MIKTAWEELRASYAGDVVGFVKEQCHIEDRDAPELVVPFELWPEQEAALESIRSHKLNIVLKARQLGLSWLSLSYAAWMMLAKPGAQVLALSRTEEEAKELVRRMGVILGNMPELVRPTPWAGASYTMRTLDVSLELCGLTSVFKAFPSASIYSKTVKKAKTQAPISKY